MIKPNDDDRHVVARIFSVTSDSLCTAHIQDLFAQLAQDQLVPLMNVRLKSLTDKSHQILVAHGIPDAVTPNNDEFPLRV